MRIDCLSTGVVVADHLCAPVSHLPEPGELVLTERLVLNIGGCAANLAIDLARQGASVGLAGCVGQDIFGRFVAETLNEAGVDTRGLRQLAEVGTAGTLIVNVSGQDRRFIHALGANAVMQPSDIPLDLVRNSRVLYVGGYLLLAAMDPHALAEVFAAARAADVLTVLDVVVPGPGDHFSALEPLLPVTDLFLPNDDEARAITGLSDPIAQAQRFQDAGARTTVITAGANGTWLVNDQMRLRAGAYEVEFVDGTGAGDAFDAGFIAGLLAGWDERRCLQYGSALGASCVRAVGTTPGVFTRAEAEAYIDLHPLQIDTL